ASRGIPRVARPRAGFAPGDPRPGGPGGVSAAHRLPPAPASSGPAAPGPPSGLFLTPLQPHDILRHRKEGGMGDFEKLVLPGPGSIHPYPPGKPAEELERELGIPGALKFASNENPHGPSPLALEAMREAIQFTHRYGDAGSHFLRQDL